MSTAKKKTTVTKSTQDIYNQLFGKHVKVTLKDGSEITGQLQELDVAHKRFKILSGRHRGWISYELVKEIVAINPRTGAVIALSGKTKKTPSTK